METPYLDSAIKRHEKALEINMLSDGGKEALIEFKAIKQALRIHDVVRRSEQLKCDTCKSGLIDYPDINRRTCRCGGLGYNGMVL